MTRWLYVEKKYTMKDIAEACGVSTAMVAFDFFNNVIRTCIDCDAENN